MTIDISPRDVLMFINLLLLIGQIGFYILVYRHFWTQSNRVLKSNASLIESVSSLAEILNKGFEQNTIEGEIKIE